MFDLSELHMHNGSDCIPVDRVLGESVQGLNDLLEKSFIESVERVVDVLDAARERESTIFIAGNGGSAATASHWVNDMGKATRRSDKAPVRVMSLSDNVSWLTALGNDEGYDRIFAGQLENFATRGDVLVLISASGNSPNLIRAAELAKSRGVITIGLLGFDGGSLQTMVDESILIRTEAGAYGLVESAHSLICHVVTTCLAGEQQRPEAQ